MGLRSRLYDGTPTTSDVDGLMPFAEEYNDLRIAASSRLQRMQDYRAENKAGRERDTARFGGSNSDYGRNSVVRDAPRHDIPLPFGKALNVKHSYRIAGQLPDVIVDQRDESPEERHRSDTMEKIVWGVIRASGATFMPDGAWDASEIGAACFSPYFDIKDQVARIRRIDPAGVVEVPGVDDPHDFERIYRAWDVPLRSLKVQYGDRAFRDNPIALHNLSPRGEVEGVDVVTVVECVGRQKTTRFAWGAQSAVGLEEYVHNYGFVNYVVIPNVGPYSDIWGWADYEFIRALQSYMTAEFSREADVLRAVGNGGMTAEGTGQNPEEIKRVAREGGVLPIKRDGKVSPIEAPAFPDFHQGHVDRGMEMFKMLGFAPDAAWGKPGSSSGTDRGLQLQPMVEYTAMKQLNWQSGLSRLFDMVFRMIEQKTAATASYSGTKPQGRGAKQTRFQVLLGPSLDPIQQPTDDGQIDDETGAPLILDLPRTPKELFNGEYAARFVWSNRIDPDDPSFVTSELAKFTQGAQSLETTLERLGFQAPEDEMRRIESESKRFPWINSGMIALLTAQLRGNAQGQGGGAPTDDAGAVQGALDTMSGGGGGQSGALDADAGFGMLPGSPAPHYGSA